MSESVVPDAVRPPPGNPRFPLIDGVRALAVLGVVGFHAASSWGYQGHWWGRFASHLDVGVTIFFVVSGFLLYRPFVAARLDEGPRPRIGAYVRRRALRIVPAYWLALTLLAIYPGLIGVVTHNWWVYYGFLQNYRVAWGGFGQGLGQAWSLCTEVAFYIALPLLAACAGRFHARDRFGRIRNELIALGLLSLASLWFRNHVHTHPFPDSQWLPGMFDWFAVGMAFAVASAAASHTSPPPRPIRHLAAHPLVCWGIATVLFTLAGALDRENPGLSSVTDVVWLAEHLIYGGVALFVVLPAVFESEESGLPRRFLAHPVIAWLGLVSYGIFLWHLTILSQLDRWGVTHAIGPLSFVPLFLACLAASTGFAALSYYGLERPLLRLKERRGSALIALPILLTLSVVSLFGVGRDARQRSLTLPTLCIIVSHLAQPEGCQPTLPDGQPVTLWARSIRFSDGSQLPIVPSWVRSNIDVFRKGDSPFLGDIAHLQGWAASPKGRSPASSILIFSFGRFVGAVKPTLSRPDVGIALRDNALDRSGFAVDLPLASLRRRGKVMLELIAVEATAASRIPLGCKIQAGQRGC